MIKIKLLLSKLLVVLICCCVIIPNNVFASDMELIKSFEEDMSYYQRVVVPTGFNSRIIFLEKVIEKYQDKNIGEKYLKKPRMELLELYSGQYENVQKNIKLKDNEIKNIPVKKILLKIFCFLK